MDLETCGDSLELGDERESGARFYCELSSDTDDTFAGRLVESQQVKVGLTSDFTENLAE